MRKVEMYAKIIKMNCDCMFEIGGRGRRDVICSWTWDKTGLLILTGKENADGKLRESFKSKSIKGDKGCPIGLFLMYQTLGTVLGNSYS